MRISSRFTGENRDNSHTVRERAVRRVKPKRNMAFSICHRAGAVVKLLLLAMAGISINIIDISSNTCFRAVTAFPEVLIRRFFIFHPPLLYLFQFCDHQFQTFCGITAELPRTHICFQSERIINDTVLFVDCFYGV